MTSGSATARRRVAVVTGASSGIGEATAAVALVARSFTATPAAHAGRPTDAWRCMEDARRDRGGRTRLNVRFTRLDRAPMFDQ